MALSILAALVASVAGVAGAQTVTEFPLPTSGSNPGGITAGPDGNLWFVEGRSNKIGRITTAGDITEFSIPTPASGSAGIAAGPDGNLWFTEEASSKIGRITTAGDITEFSILNPGKGPNGIAVGADGNLWFTERGFVGRITTSGAIIVVPISRINGPSSIAAGPDGNLWFTEYYGGTIGRITTGGVPLHEFSTEVDAVSIAAGPDGSLWLTQSGEIGRMTTAGVVTEFAIPSGTIANGITTGPDGSLWFTETVGNKIGRITTAGDVTEFSIPTAGSGPGGIVAGPDGNLWFTETVGNKIGRITPGGQPSPCVADSTTLCLNSGRFQVRTEWQAPLQGTSGHGTAVSLTADTGYFWFFSAANIEVVVKVLNGCSNNGRYWVFAGGLTNLGVLITVTDTQTGVAETYTNPAGTAFQPIQDTTAFSACP